jgi:hypothetical protein
MRDARITTIYEGTTGIQANDLIGRKIAREGGVTLKSVLAQMSATQAELAASSGADLQAIGTALGEGVAAVTQAGDYIVANFTGQVREVVTGAVPFLRLLGIVAGGWQMGRAALAAQAKVGAGETAAFYSAKIITARFYAEHVLNEAAGLAREIVAGGASALALDADQF